MKVYVVGEWGAEHNMILSVHRTKQGAFVAWNKKREELLSEAKHYLETSFEDSDMFKRIVQNLSCTIPEKLDSGPHDAPYIMEFELKK